MSEIHYRSNSNYRTKEVLTSGPAQRFSSFSESNPKENAIKLKEIPNFQNEKQNRESNDEKIHANHRINSLIAEVNRLGQENNDLVAQLHQERLKSGDLRKLKNSGKIKNAVDRTLQNELKYEKEESLRLRHLLGQIENERADLRSKLKDYEIAASANSYEKIELLNKLQQTSELIRVIENEKIDYIQVIDAANQRNSQLEVEISNLTKKTNNLCQALSELENEKSEMNEKFNEETNKLREILMEKNIEIDNIKFIHNKHSRVLASQNIGKIIEKIKIRLDNLIFCKIENFANLQKSKNISIHRILQLPLKYFWRKQKYFLDVWRSHLNWRIIFQTRINFIEKYAQSKTRSRLFHEWKNLFLYKRFQRENKVRAMFMFRKIFEITLRKNIKKKLLTWKNRNDHENIKSYNIKRLALHKFISKLRNIILTWKTNANKIKDAQRKDDLATDFSAVFVKIKFFQALKEYTKLKNIKRKFKYYKDEQADKIFKNTVLQQLHKYTQKRVFQQRLLRKVFKRIENKELFKVLSKWLNEVKIEKKSMKVNKFLISNDLVKDKRVIQSLFLAWKNFIISNKFTRTLAELSIEKPKREELEEILRFSQNESKRTKSIAATRLFIKYFKDDLLSYFTKWAVKTRHYHNQIPKIKTMFVKEYKLRVSNAFMTWKKFINDKENLKLAEICQSKNEENLNLIGHINNLESVLTESMSKLDDIRKNFMKSTIYKLKNYLVKTALRKWATLALCKTNKLSATQMINNKIKCHILKWSFKSIKIQSIHSKKKEVRNRILQKASEKSNSKQKMYCLGSWKQFVSIIKLFQNIFIKYQKRKKLTVELMLFNTWKKQLFQQKEYKLKVFSNELTQNNLNLTLSIENLEQMLEQESLKSSNIVRTLKKSSKLRIINALNHYTQQSKKDYFMRWIIKIQNSLIKNKALTKMIIIWEKQYLRAALKNWDFYIRNMIFYKHSIEIKKQVKIAKAANRKTKEIQKEFEKELDSKAEKLTSLEKELICEEKIKKFFLNRSVKQFETNYSISRSAFAFNLMKVRFYSLKKTLNKFVKRLKVITKKFSFNMIRKTSNENYYLMKLKKLLIETFKRYNKRFIRYRFDVWHRNSTSIYTRLIENNIVNAKNEISLLENDKSKINKHYHQQILNFLTGHNKKNIFDGWSKIIKVKKRVKASFRTFIRTNLYSKASKAIKMWISRTHETKNLMLKLSNSLSFTKLKLKKSIFSVWKSELIKTKKLFKILSNIEFNFTATCTLYSFMILKNLSHSTKINQVWGKRTKNHYLTAIFSSTYKKSLMNYLSRWSRIVCYSNSCRLHLKKSIFHSLHRKFRSAFSLWQESILVQKTESKTNKMGQVAHENIVLKERNMILESLIKSEGIDPRYVERYINERETLITGLKRKGISYIRYKAGLVNKNDSSLAPKIFLTWRLWTVKRKRIQKLAFRVMSFRKKPELMHAFLTWKNGFTLVVNTVNKNTRKELFGIIARMDRDLKTIEGKLENTNNEMIYLKAYSGVLEEHTKRGQNLALVVCQNNMVKSYYRTFLRWVMHTNLCKVHDILSQLAVTEENFFISQSNFKNLEQDNEALNEENLELRQASLDGVAIADAFETLSKEREKLSIDLAERTLVIKRLMEQNNELSFKLKQLGTGYS